MITIPTWLALIGGIAIMLWIISFAVIAVCFTTAEEHNDWD